ncbi:ABC transporter substrate-binding protein [Pacificibacter marinus]|uniref:ABC transporter substrate-binding protein n=1 Tax=Pacificibacter marinus TaxID=658057 RepID=UPI001C0680E7|nr:extracellular solute-binding protein [Pacificibacter marinus]MBU2867892.1 extracellular solute-binding protein [Pacificibacter marinus]
MSVSQSRRNFLKHSSAAFGSFAMTVVAGGALAQGTTKIRFSGFVESEEQLATTLRVLKAYEAKNPGVEIIPEFSSYRAFTDKLATEAAGGNAPDMFSVNVDLLAEYAARGALTPLTPWIPDTLDVSGYQDGSVFSCTYAGEMYAMPNDAIATAMFYNPLKFEEVGVPVPEKFYTWEKLLETAVALSKEHGRGFWGIEDGGGNNLACDLFLRSMGKALFTPEHTIGFSGEDAAKWFQYWEDMRQEGGAPPADVQAQAGDNSTSLAIVRGRAAMLIQTTDSFIGIGGLMSDPLDLMMLPNGWEGGEMKQHHYDYAGNSTGIWTKAANKDLCVDIIRFMHFDPEGVELYYTGSGMIPASTAGMEKFGTSGTPEEKKIVEYLKMLREEPAPSRRPGVGGLGGIFRRHNEAVAFGDMTALEAGNSIAAEIDGKLQALK